MICLHMFIMLHLLVYIASSTSSSNIKNDICMLKNSINRLGSTLSYCAMNHTQLESMFQKKHAPPMYAHHTRHTHDSHICHVPIASFTSDKHNACSTLSSNIKNDICVLKKSVDCLGSTLSLCAMNHTQLESMFHKKHAPHMHALKSPRGEVNR